MADTVHPTEIVKELKALRRAQNFFDHAYHELSHEAVLAYAFEAIERQIEGRKAEEATAVFGQALLGECFGKDVQGEAFRYYRQYPLKSGRPDFLLRLEKEGRGRWAVLETKLHAAARAEQLRQYEGEITEHEDFQEGRDELAALVLYKTGTYYDTIREDETVVTARRVLTAPRILEHLEEVLGENGRCWPLEEYRDWLRRRVLRDKFLAHPEVQDWYYGKEGAPQEVTEEIERLLHNSSSQKRRLHWHFLARLAARMVENHKTEEAREEVYHQLNSDWNRAGSSAWVNFQIAKFEAEKWASAFYRIDHNDECAWLDLRLYAGPKRGSGGKCKEKWRQIKKRFLKNLRQGLEREGLTEIVDLPGYQGYRFNKSSKETSMCRFWLPDHEEGLLPSEIAGHFPAVHEAAIRAIEGMEGLQPCS